MAVYFVLGSILVAWGLGLAIFGLLRPDFPPSGTAGRALVGITVLIVVATLTALLATTEREHPREEAAAEAAEKKAEESKPGGEAKGGAPPPAGAPTPGPNTVNVTEKEFSITLAGGNTIAPGKTTFAVQNAGKIQHDLAIKGAGENVKTPLISGGQSKDLKANLNPGKYLFYCSVPGHEQAGMKVNVTVGT
jgi:plastocyanin